MRRIALAALAAAAAAGCATTGAGAPPVAGRFAAVRSLVLARSAADRGQRAKDPLDGLEESLRARGFATRIVELGGEGAAEEPALERLFALLEVRAGAERAERVANPVSSAGREAAAAVAALGVDAVASYHRLDRRRPLAAPPAGPGTLFPAPAPAAPERPLGALALVDREGRVAIFAWGDAGALEDPFVPLNAAEAIDLLVGALTGEPPER
jgi:hypothetical protein